MKDKVDDLQRKIRVLLNVDDQTSKRLRSIEYLRAFFSDSQNQAILSSSYDKLLAMLRQLFNDRVPAIRTQTALLLGLLGTVSKANIPNFSRWVFSSMENLKRDKKLLFLATLKEFLVKVDKASLRPVTPAILSSICNFLEIIEHHELLVPTIEVILFLKTHFPQQFAPHFKVPYSTSFVSC